MRAAEIAEIITMQRGDASSREDYVRATFSPENPAYTA